MDIKDWILIGGGILLVAVIAHGFWLAYRSRNEQYKLAIDPDLIPKGDFDPMATLRGELPNGGARVRPATPEPTMDAQDFVLVPPQPAPSALRTENRGHGAQRREAKPYTPRQTAAVAQPRRKPEVTRRESTRTRPLESPSTVPAQAEPAATPPNPDELVVVHVLARNSAKFEGIDLMAAFMRNALKFGNMNIFHRVDPVTKETRFSVANAVNPGTFDLAAMDGFSTPGVSFFLNLQDAPEPVQTFDDMLVVARDVAASLEGDLKDEQRCVMTAQTIEHCRERIAEYSRKRMSQRA
jgi:cell division protein ZipA